MTALHAVSIHLRLRMRQMCKWGTDAHVVLPSGKTIAVDSCIADFVDRLNKAGIETVASCCGHGNLPVTIALADGRWLIVTDRTTRERFEATLGVDIHGEQMPPNSTQQELSQAIDYIERLEGDRAKSGALERAARELLGRLRAVGEQTGWRDGEETDRVYSWAEFANLRRLLSEHNG